MLNGSYLKTQLNKSLYETVSCEPCLSGQETLGGGKARKGPSLSFLISFSQGVTLSFPSYPWHEHSRDYKQEASTEALQKGL